MDWDSSGSDVTSLQQYFFTCCESPKCGDTLFVDILEILCTSDSFSVCFTNNGSVTTEQMMWSGDFSLVTDFCLQLLTLNYIGTSCVFIFVIPGSTVHRWAAAYVPDGDIFFFDVISGSYISGSIRTSVGLSQILSGRDIWLQIMRTLPILIKIRLIIESSLLREEFQTNCWIWYRIWHTENFDGTLNSLFITLYWVRVTVRGSIGLG